MHAFFGLPEVMTSLLSSGGDGIYVYTTPEYVFRCAVACVSFAVLRVILDKYVFQTLGAAVVLQPKERRLARLPDKRQTAVDKFTESLWKFLAYLGLCCWAYFALHDKDWLWDTSRYWVSHTEQPQSRRVMQLLWVQTGYYVNMIFMLRLWETRRKDYPVMMAHHFTTLGLLVFAYALHLERIGSVVLLLHDFSDILLELAKLLNYAKMELAANITFAAMAASWFYLRLVIFPRHIVWSTLHEYQIMHDVPLPNWWGVNGLLCTLVVMHAYWFWLILKVAAKALKKGSAEDVREEDDD